MTPEQITLVEQTWNALPVSGPEFAKRCYDDLFRKQPQLRVLFEGFLDDQHQKLAHTLDHTIRGLHRGDEKRPEVNELGRRHRDYGVKDHHYAAVGDSLLATLSELHGPAFTPEAREAWLAFYSELAAAMQTHAHGTAH